MGVRNAAGQFAPQPTAKHKNPCSIDGCGKLATGGRGWCPAHWKKWRTWGDPLAEDQRKPIDVGKRLRSKLKTAPNGCWLWQGAKNAEGYGRIYHLGRLDYTHRVSYELANGPIPEGLDVDHLCRTPACCNPEHLEPVTRAVNLQRARGAVA